MSDAPPKNPIKVGAAAPVPQQRFTLAQRLPSTLTTPSVAAPLIILSLALLCWSAVAHMNARNLVVNARPVVTGDTNVVTAEVVSELESNARVEAQQLIRDRGMIARTLSRLEQQARGGRIPAALPSFARDDAQLACQAALPSANAS